MALKKKLSRDELIELIGDQNIYEYYFGQEINLNKCYQSVFRDDTNFSTGFYLSKNGHLVYNDFATGEKLDCVAFVAHKFQVNYYKAADIIAVDFGLLEGVKSGSREAIIIKRRPLLKQERIIKISAAPFTEKHLDFWAKFTITEQELKENNVYAVKDLLINDYMVPVNEEELRFAYLVKTLDKSYLKIYSPYSKEYKWVSNVPLNIPFGLENLLIDLDGNNTLFITKGLKDMIILKKFFPNVIATQNESFDSLTEELVKKLKLSYNKIYVWYDQDKAGIFAANKLKEVYDFIPVFTPQNTYDNYGIKDLSDFVKHFGLTIFKQYLSWLKLI